MIDRIVLSEVKDVKDIIHAVDEYQKGVIAVVDDNNKLLGIVTDGDVRRAILRGELSIENIVNRYPTTLLYGTCHSSIINKLLEIKSFIIPLINHDGEFVEFYFLERKYNIYNTTKVVIMAGGLGSRLGELTQNTPKPMLKIGNYPMLEHIIKSFKEYGFVNFILCVNYKSEIIKDYFQSGEKWNIDIKYIKEEKRLGTGGALSLLHSMVEGNFFVINGDVLSTLDYKELLCKHEKDQSLASMCLHKIDYQIPYGVIKTNENDIIVDITEKPTLSYYINTGIYVLNSSILSHIPYNTFYDLPTLFKDLQRKNITTKGYVVSDFWLDMGQKDQYLGIKKYFEL